MLLLAQLLHEHLVVGPSGEEEATDE